MEKMTKRNAYEAIVNYVESGKFTYQVGDEVFEVSPEALKEFAENEIGLLDRKSEKNKERAAAKRAEADGLTDVVKGMLNTEEFLTIPDLMERVEDPELTKGKVSYRLGKLVESGEVERADVPVVGEDGKKRKIKGYKLSQ